MDPPPPAGSEQPLQLHVMESALIPAEAEPRPATQQQPPTPCLRQMGSMTALRRWERALLALVHDTSESEFESVTLYVGPILIAGFTDAFKTAIVRTALQHGYAITIDREIWFP